jgi:hypothetical protein
LKRLEQSLNKPAVVLVVGVVAVALNVLLYFGYFLPRTTPFVEQIYSIGTSLPEAISRSDSESGSQSDPKAGSKSDSGSSDTSSGTSGSDGGGGSDSGGSIESGSDPSSASSSASRPDSTSGSNAAGTQPQQQSDVAPQSPDRSPPPPELPTLPSPSQQQYQ